MGRIPNEDFELSKLSFLRDLRKCGISTSMLPTCPASAADWLTKGCAMCYPVCVIMYVQDRKLSARRVGHCVPFGGFCLSLYSLHMLNSDVNIIQTKNKQTKKQTNNCSGSIICQFTQETLCKMSILNLRIIFRILSHLIKVADLRQNDHIFALTFINQL